MKYLLLIPLFYLGLITSTFGQTINIDSKNAVVEFTFVKDNAKGTVRGIEGEITINTDNPEKSVIKGTADVSTLNTNNKMRDKHLIANDMFNLDEHPEMTFQSTLVEKTDEGYKMTGNLTIKGISNETVIHFKEVDGNYEGITEIYTNDFDLFKQKKRENSKVEVKFIIPTS